MIALMPLTLTDFLLARIAEDGLEACAPGVAGVAGSNSLVAFDMDEDTRALVVAPSRVLAECEAKRGAIEAAWRDHCQIESEWGAGQSRETMSVKDDNPAAIAWLALPYADHPDYDEAWRP